MSVFSLTLLKILFLLLLYVFVWRVVRTARLEIRRAGGRQEEESPGEPRAAPAARRPPGSVVVVDASGAKLDPVPLEGPVRIGRTEACQIRLDDTFASSLHARIYPREESWFVEDLDSTNGTFLNERRLTGPVEVHAGDRVRIGTTTLELVR